MADEADDGAGVRIPPPLVFLGILIAGVLAHFFVMPLPIRLSMGLRIALTFVVLVPGVVLIGGALGLFRRTGQDPAPWKPTPEIVSTGVYRFTRNPMYVAMAVLQVAIGLALANWWIILLTLASLAIVYVTAVRHEERYLERKFGEEYTRYRTSVRRWL